MSNIVVFDLDGVITSEEAYWDTAGLVLHELLYSPQYWNIGHSGGVYTPPSTAVLSHQLSAKILPESVIVDLKARSVNSNWDTCYAGFCLYLIHLLALLPDCADLLPLRPWEQDWTESFREQLARLPGALEIDPARFHVFETPLFRGYSGLELLQRFDAYASEVLGQHIEGVFARYSPSWDFCKDLFQEWYLGEELYTRSYGHAPAQAGKPGCIHFEKPLLPVEQLYPALEKLQALGYTLGIATGRPGQESITPLQNYGLLRYFAAQHIVTHDQVAEAERGLKACGGKQNAPSLVKPHPYQFARAANPAYQPGQPALPRGSFIVVGDTPSDVRGGRAAGAIVIAVLTGARTPEARALLAQSQPDFIVEDITKVPALLEQIDDLATIQRLQFSERAKAELLLQHWFTQHMGLQTEAITLTPKPVSLNSFNGIYRLGSEEYFFKTHVEEQGVLEEYYHAELLHKAGYNIVRPLHTVHEKGQQMVVYPVVHWPVMFDLMRAVETGDTSQASVAMLVEAEKRECERLLRIYQATLQASTADEHARAPIHQLFWHRITGGRLHNFYSGKLVALPATGEQQVGGIPFDELLGYRWMVNGRALEGSLGELIERAKVVLNPARAALTVIGHGDAHFGNVFLEREQDYLYFDPAFAGRHSPLLDVVKPLFHNVYASWMYFPQEIARDLQVSVALRGSTVSVEHNYVLAPVRQALWETKLTYLFGPLKEFLRAQLALPDDWSELVRLALMCCPLLTVNLLDEKRMPASVSWLGLSQVMEMANLASIGAEA
ncbi:HAD family hydrolase [Ktedonosporobacter rubrisoli]|uniref:HAD family hydrolase n=1 Tax=Ktedonosporobacter rubrisoli TaxID=2509675 RepID=A0A4V0YYZ4_KTERU|nr:HAD hydrolase-like protein [Ktedonosporobacter rubrisoli]QBD77931.1 HAD family hydrolase [Ktedonosporobacter rubrisoli]